MSNIKNKINKEISIDILAKGRVQENFVGRPFYIDYRKLHLMTCDAWKFSAKGIPQGSFLLAFYDGEPDVEEALLLRVLNPISLPTDSNNILSMIAYYKDNMDIAGRAGTPNSGKLDDFTRYEFSFSGLECRVLGAFYKTPIKNTENETTNFKTEFGADVENFYSANNYKVYKATDEVLKEIVNQRDNENIIVGNNNEFKIGKIRYSSSRRFHNSDNDVPVYISPKDFLGKRTSLFGMTRTGKSNTMKKIIEATVEISEKAKNDLPNFTTKENELFNDLEMFDNDDCPKYGVGQIIFDVNGEYANANMQDKGTAIFELYKKHVTRYSVMEKTGFEVMKVNFYEDITTGFELISNYLREKKLDSIYITNFLAVDLDKPEDYDSNRSSKVRYDRKLAAYLCCLYKAGFLPPSNFKVAFSGQKDINETITLKGIFPEKGISLNEASSWFIEVWTNYDNSQKPWDYISNYKKTKGKEWADDDLKALLAFLSQYKSPDKKGSVSGWRILKSNDLLTLHTNTRDTSFEEDIIKLLRIGKIIIIDLSQGTPVIKKMFSERLCTHIFNDSMNRFIASKPNNFIQFYFEESHNLFPKKDDKDLSQIYNRIAKEGAKLNLGMIYATQEPSSISSNILKNTQNWFIAHLNNEEELREIKKYYDFGDFVDSLVSFSATNDKGFIKMKTYTNPFVIPVQIDRFLADK